MKKKRIFLLFTGFGAYLFFNAQSMACSQVEQNEIAKELSDFRGLCAENGGNSGYRPRSGNGQELKRALDGANKTGADAVGGMNPAGIQDGGQAAAAGSGIAEQVNQYSKKACGVSAKVIQQKLEACKQKYEQQYRAGWQNYMPMAMQLQQALNQSDQRFDGQSSTNNAGQTAGSATSGSATPYNGAYGGAASVFTNLIFGAN